MLETGVFLLVTSCAEANTKTRLLIIGISFGVIVVAAPLAVTPAEALADDGGTCCSAPGSTCVVTAQGAFLRMPNSCYSSGRC
jgi:hypothetical protein